MQCKIMFKVFCLDDWHFQKFIHAFIKFFILHLSTFYDQYYRLYFVFEMQSNIF